MSSLDLLFRVLTGCKRVVTDRLHIAIAGALLGLEVELHPNSYYKNRAVYDYSLRRFSNVRFAMHNKTSTRANFDDWLTDVGKDPKLANHSIRTTLLGLRKRDSVRVECSLGEIVDKITILKLKEQNIVDETALAHVRREIGALQQAWYAEGLPAMESLEVWMDLLEVNRRLWTVENNLRECERRCDFGDRFVQLARSVYQLNDWRAELKRVINETFGSRLVEQKSYVKYGRNSQAVGAKPYERDPQK
jgi:hypothetical protein